jgi:hypothetical protein
MVIKYNIQGIMAYHGYLVHIQEKMVCKIYKDQNGKLYTVGTQQSPDGPAVFISTQEIVTKMDYETSIQDSKTIKNVNSSRTGVFSSYCGAAEILQGISLGLNAGVDTISASYSILLGTYAGNNATYAGNSIFLGQFTGKDAVNAHESTFIGLSAGNSATTANNSIFLGVLAGSRDIVNNSVDTNDYSILIGARTSTGGFSNSIAIGGLAINTATNQLMIGSATRAINEVKIVGDNTTLHFNLGASTPSPTSAGTVGEIRVIGGYIYICTGTTTWVRTTQEITW